MKAKTAAIAALIFGLLIGSGVAFLTVSDPGSEFAFLEPQPYTSFEPKTKVESVGNDVEPAQPTDPADVEKDRLPLEVLGGEEFDFGVMDEGERKSHTFTLRNNTNEEITLSVVETTCKCTVGKMEDDVIPPNSEVGVTLEWKPVALQRDFRQSATIATSFDGRKDILLSVFGQVQRTIVASPSNIAFSDVSFRSDRESELVIYALEDPDFKITGHTWANVDIAEHFSYERIALTDEHQADEEDAQVVVAGIVKLKAGLPLGPFNQVLQLQTNETKFGVLEIPVRGRIVGDITLTGAKFNESRNRLRMGPVPQVKGGKTKMQLTVKGPAAKKFKINSFRSVPEQIDVEVVNVLPIRNGRVMLLTLEVSIAPGAKPANYMGGNEHELGKVIMETNHPQLKEVAFDVEFAITE